MPRLSEAAENPEELLFPLCCRKTVAHNNEAKMANKTSLSFNSGYHQKPKYMHNYRIITECLSGNTPSADELLFWLV